MNKVASEALNTKNGRDVVAPEPSQANSSLLSSKSKSASIGS